MSPSTRTALYRLIVAESSRFPNLAAIMTNQGASEEVIRLIASVLECEARAGNLTLDNPTLAAQQFLHMVIALPQRRAMGLGMPMTSVEVDSWARDVVNLFLNGPRLGARGDALTHAVVSDWRFGSESVPTRAGISAPSRSGGGLPSAERFATIRR